MNNKLSKLTALLALIIGGMAIFAGGKVLLGNDPGYYVINWLPLYNYTIGILTVFITAILIWTNNSLAIPAAIGTFSSHAIVMLLLQTVYSGVVAPDSIRAMTIRLAALLIILVMLLPQWRNNRKSA
jgi:hypothetical protein